MIKKFFSLGKMFRAMMRTQKYGQDQRKFCSKRANEFHPSKYTGLSLHSSVFNQTETCRLLLELKNIRDQWNENTPVLKEMLQNKINISILENKMNSSILESKITFINVDQYSDFFMQDWLKNDPLLNEFIQDCLLKSIAPNDWKNIKAEVNLFHDYYPVFAEPHVQNVIQKYKLLIQQKDNYNNANNMIFCTCGTVIFLYWFFYMVDLLINI